MNIIFVFVEDWLFTAFYCNAVWRQLRTLAAGRVSKLFWGPKRPPTYTNNWQLCMYIETTWLYTNNCQFCMYVETTSLYTNNWQFCMYIETTSSQSSAALRLFLRRQVSRVRASAPWDGPALADPGAGIPRREISLLRNELLFRH